MNVIRSYKHEVYTEVVNKIALCSNDDKRYIQEGLTDTLALWHYRIEIKYFSWIIRKIFLIFYSIILKFVFSVF